MDNEMVVVIVRLWHLALIFFFLIVWGIVFRKAPGNMFGNTKLKFNKKGKTGITAISRLRQRYLKDNSAIERLRDLAEQEEVSSFAQQSIDVKEQTSVLGEDKEREWCLFCKYHREYRNPFPEPDISDYHILLCKRKRVKVTLDYHCDEWEPMCKTSMTSSL